MEGKRTWAKDTVLDGKKRNDKLEKKRDASGGTVYARGGSGTASRSCRPSEIGDSIETRGERRRCEGQMDIFEHVRIRFPGVRSCRRNRGGGGRVGPARVTLNQGYILMQPGGQGIRWGCSQALRSFLREDRRGTPGLWLLTGSRISRRARLLRGRESAFDSEPPSPGAKQRGGGDDRQGEEERLPAPVLLRSKGGGEICARDVESSRDIGRLGASSWDPGGPRIGDVGLRIPRRTPVGEDTGIQGLALVARVQAQGRGIPGWADRMGSRGWNAQRGVVSRRREESTSRYRAGACVCPPSCPPRKVQRRPGLR